jgi:hypothetical protein
LLSPIVSKKLQTKRPIMLKVTTEVPVPTPPPTKSKRLEIIFRTRASKKLKTYYLGGF